MEKAPKIMSISPVVGETMDRGFAPNLVEMLDRSLMFQFFEGRETMQAFPHTTGVRELPFSTLSCQFEDGSVGTAYIDGYPEITFSPGDALLIPRGVQHEVVTTSAHDTHALWTHFSFQLPGGIDVFDLVVSPAFIPAAQAGEGREALRGVIESYSVKPDANPLALVARRRQAASRLLAFLGVVCRPRRDIGGLMETSRRLQPALVHIHEHYAGPIGCDDLAQLANLSRSRFHHLFRELTGTSAFQYLKHRRLQAAQTLLLTTDQSIKQISAAVGYDDALHFSRIFTAAVGCSPREYKERNAQP